MAANPLKVLVELQAKRGAIVSGSTGLEVEHDALIKEDLTVEGLSTLKGNATAEGTLTVEGASTLEGAVAAQAGITVTGAPIDASAVAVSASTLNVGSAAYVGGDLTVQGDFKVLGTIDAINRTELHIIDSLIVAAKGAADGAAANGGGLKVEGANAELTYANADNAWHMNKDLKIAGKAETTGDLSIGGVSDFAGAVEMASTLEVTGDMHGLANLEIDGTSQFDGAVSMSDGLTVAGDKFIAQAAAEISGGLKIADLGIEVLGGGATVTGDISGSAELKIAGASQLNSTLAVAGVASFTSDVSASAGLKVTGASQLVGAAQLDSTLDVDGAVEMNSTLHVVGAAEFDADVQADALLKVAASGSLVNISAAQATGYVDVAKAIKLLDTLSGDNKTAVINAYNHLRFQKTGAFTAGQAIVNLTSEGYASMFDSASLDFIALDVMVKDGAGDWQNDLVAVHMFLDGSDVKVQIDALTEATDFRLIAINEKSGKFSW